MPDRPAPALSHSTWRAPQDDPEESIPPPLAADDQPAFDQSDLDMAGLRSRIESVQEAEWVQERLEAMPCAWGLIFDADTEDEAV